MTTNDDDNDDDSISSYCDSAGTRARTDARSAQRMRLFARRIFSRLLPELDARSKPPQRCARRGAHCACKRGGAPYKRAGEKRAARDDPGSGRPLAALPPPTSEEVLDCVLCGGVCSGSPVFVFILI